MQVGKRAFVSFVMGVLALAVLPFGVFAATTAAATPSLVLRILQIVWIVAAIVSFGVLLYGFAQMRRSRDDLMGHEQAKRIVLFSGIACVISLILFGVITFFIIRSQPKQSVSTVTPQGTEIDVGFGTQQSFTNVTQHYPTRDQRNVPRNAVVLISFKEEVNLQSIMTGQSVLDAKAISLQKLRDDDVPLGDPTAAHVQGADDKKSIKILPDQLLGTEGETSTKYKVTIFPTVQTSQRASMLGGTGSYSWVFYVGTIVDVAAPQVVSVFPGIREAVAHNALVQITFSKAIDPTTVNKTGVQFTNTTSQGAISGTLSQSNNFKTITFTPNEICGSNSCNERVFCLPSGSRISGRLKTATITTPRSANQPNGARIPYDGITDAQGNSLDGGGENGLKKDTIAQGTKEDDYTWSFDTLNTMDTSAPTLLSVTPGRNGTRVDRTAPIQLRFSKIMDIGSLLSNSITLDKGIQYWLDSSLDLDKKQTTVSVSHDQLKENTIYSPDVHGDVRDIYQNCFASCAGPLQ